MDALTITLKDLMLLVRDRRALVILVVMPMVIIAIVGSSTGRLQADRDESRQGLTIEVVDFDHSESSARLPGFMAGYENVIVRQAEVSQDPDSETMETLQTAPPTGNADVRLVIRSGFEAGFRAMSPTELTTPDKSRQARGFEAIGLTLVFRKSADPMMEGLTKMLVRLSLQQAILPLVAEKIPSFRGAARRSVIPEPWEKTVTVKKSAAPNRMYQFFVPSYTVLFVFFLVNVMGRSFLDERRNGTLRRLRVSPISPAAILAGKTVPFLVLSVIQTTILLISGKILFGMSWGPQPLLLVPIMLATSTAATSLGLLFSTIVKTESQVSSIGNLIVLSSAGISGCLVPRAWMPPLSQQISLLTPHAWALDAYSEVLTKDSPDLRIIALSSGMLLLFAAVFFVTGLFRFRDVE